MARTRTVRLRCSVCGAYPRRSMAEHMKAEHSGRWWTEAGQKAIVRRWKQRRQGKHTRGLPPGGYAAYIDSPQWKKKARKIKRKRNRCEVCGCRDRLQVHHLNYDRLGHERPDDLLVLCEDCHIALHTGLPQDKLAREHMATMAARNPRPQDGEHR